MGPEAPVRWEAILSNMNDPKKMEERRAASLPQDKAPGSCQAPALSFRAPIGRRRLLGTAVATTHVIIHALRGVAMEHTIEYEGAERRALWPGLQRVRWGAVFAGLFFTVVTQMLLTVLGLAIGLTAVDPRQGAPGEAFGWGAAIWAVLSLIVSLFVGAYMTGRLSNVSNRGDGALNGALTWAVSLVVMLYLVGSGAASLVSGVFGLLGTAANTAAVVAGQTAGSVASNGNNVVNQAKETVENLGINVDRLQQRAENTAQSAQNTAERATTPGTPENQQAKQAAAKAADYAAGGAWSLLIAALIGLAIAAWAGALGAAADMHRTATLRTTRTTVA